MNDKRIILIRAKISKHELKEGTKMTPSMKRKYEARKWKLRREYYNLQLELNLIPY